MSFIFTLIFVQKKAKLTLSYLHETRKSPPMKRIIDYFLLEWQSRTRRKPLILRGARQVGKTHAIRQLGKTFTHFIEVNLETNEAARSIMQKDLDIQRIRLQLSELLKIKIEPGSTLLFFDEIQNVPQALIALRYFYEDMPELHVIAAGSLLDFAIEEVGIPVGRISQLYMYPLSFLEFLVAMGHKEWAELIISKSPLFDQLHEKLIDLVGIYLAIGGLPEAVNEWLETTTTREVRIIHEELLYTYVQDFGKYAKKHQIKYLDLVFKNAIKQLARKFMYSRIDGYQKRELEPAINMLVKAGIMYQICQTAGQGLPIGAGADTHFFKIILLDVGLSQALLDFDLSAWIIDPLNTFVNKGELVEAFVGQELLAYSDPIKKASLYYWHRAEASSQAEVDYLIQLKGQIVPVEVKSGSSTRLKSMHTFLASHPHSSYGLRFWATMLSGKIISIHTLSML